MRYYSDVTQEFYETEKACLKAEQAHTAAARKKEEEERKKSEERKTRAREVEDARKSLDEARKKYDKLLADFCKDYGSYHYSISTPTSLSDYLETLFRF